jgi:His/Glu/Gln/Arg/opine family amino acid ABC transporter permease subunit
VTQTAPLGGGSGSSGPPPAGGTPPDTRGATSVFTRTIFWVGLASLLILLIGTVAVQIGHAGEPVTPSCVQKGIIPYTPATANGPAHGTQGAAAVCSIVEGFVSPAQAAVLIIAFLLGLAALVVGSMTYRSRESRHQRHDAVTGAILGVQALAISGVLWAFAHGTPEKFVLQFMNFQVLKGHDGTALLAGAKTTLLLAFGAELGGIVIGLVLAILMVSKLRAVRAPAIVYINLFRGTPLLVQLSIGYFGVNLGLGLHLSTLVVATIVLALNMGAYSAEVFRAGIQSIDRGQMEAARSVGMTYLQAMRYAIVPQAFRRVIPPLLNEFVILIKDTSLVLVLGLSLQQLDLFGAAQQGYSDTFSATFFLAVALGYLIITLPLIAAVNAVERRLRSGLVSVAAAGI